MSESDSKILAEHVEESSESAAVTDETTTKPTSHKKLWFEDGSIVLATDVHLYRVHKSTLASNSAVFSDMLDLKNVEGAVGSIDAASGDSWEGLPLVKMVGDSDENVYHLLMTLYNRDFYRMNKPTTLPIISSLLVMTSKYDIPIIRAEVIEHLERYYPTDISQLDKHSIKNLFPGHVSKDGSNPDEFDFQLLAIALQSNVEILLPMLYYECADKRMADIFRLSKKFKLTSDVLEKIIIGREKLSTWSCYLGVRLLEPRESCNSYACSDAKASLLVEWMKAHSYDPPEFPWQALLDGIAFIGEKELRADVCGYCLDGVANSSVEVRKEFWAEIPHIFGLGAWENLKRN